MPQSRRDLSALVGSRICHDLISPLGAIGNGVELLTMSDPSPGPEMALISQSVENANARIRFFRVAFGEAGSGQILGSNEIRAILDAVARGGRVDMAWRAEGDHARDEVRLVFLILQCFESALPYGGRVEISKTGATWVLLGLSDKLKIEPALWELLSNPAAPTEVAASDVHFALIGDSAAALGRKVSLVQDRDMLEVRV